MNSDSVLVVGNGESRKAINLARFVNRLPIVGCNAIYRDIAVDYLVCIDARLVEEVYTGSISVPVYSNQLQYNNRIVQLPTIPFLQNSRALYYKNWSSGAYALLLSATLEFTTIYIIGFDLYSTTGYVNNVYKNTVNYSSSISHAVDPAYWIYQSACIFRHFTNKSFIVVNDTNWVMPELWKLSNVQHISIDIFLSYQFHNVK